MVGAFNFFLHTVYIRIMSEWNMLVKKIFDKNRSSNSAYRLGDAMRDAKKVYKKTAKKFMNIPFEKKRRGRQTRHFNKSRKQRRRRGGDGDGTEPAAGSGGQSQSQSQKEGDGDSKGFFGMF